MQQNDNERLFFVLFFFLAKVFLQLFVVDVTHSRLARGELNIRFKPLVNSLSRLFFILLSGSLIEKNQQQQWNICRNGKKRDMLIKVSKKN